MTSTCLTQTHPSNTTPDHKHRRRVAFNKSGGGFRLRRPRFLQRPTSGDEVLTSRRCELVHLVALEHCEQHRPIVPHGSRLDTGTEFSRSSANMSDRHRSATTSAIAETTTLTAVSAVTIHVSRSMR